MSAGRLVYVNGDLVPEQDATVSVRDVGMVYGDAVFDTARTFGGKAFKLAEHVDRLFDTLAYARIEISESKDDIIKATEDVVAANLDALRSGEDYWVTIRVTGGTQNFDGEGPRNTGATIIIDCIPLPFRARANYFRDGIPAVVAARRRVAPDALSPNAKTINYMNMTLAQREVAALKPGAWALQCDVDGNIAEGAGCNFFVVKDGVVMTPATDYVLAGVSRAVVIELCETLSIPLQERAIPLQLAMTAQEAFFSSTSLCVCPVSSINGASYDIGVPGPVTQQIMTAFAELVDYDFVGQYLRFASRDTAGTGL